jgi:RNA polymerase-binding transcription factor DksA
MAGNQCNEYRLLLENEARRILAEEFHHEVPVEVPIRYFLSFKTEGRLGALRDALYRLDTNAFGCCTLCRCEIDEAFLLQDLTTRLCLRCAVGREWGMENDTDILSNNLNSNTSFESYTWS